MSNPTIPGRQVIWAWLASDVLRSTRRSHALVFPSESPGTISVTEGQGRPETLCGVAATYMTHSGVTVTADHTSHSKCPRCVLALRLRRGGYVEHWTEGDGDGA